MRSFVGMYVGAALLATAVSTGMSATFYASTVESAFKPAPSEDPARNNPLESLGTPDQKFYSLGQGGWIVLSFGEIFGADASSVTTWEITFGNSATYPESAEVYYSLDGLTYFLAGTVDNSGMPSDPESTHETSINFNALTTFKFVKLIDTSDSPDGFDLDAISVTGTTGIGNPPAVPLPAAVWGGLSLLGGLGAMRTWRRRAIQA